MVPARPPRRPLLPPLPRATRLWVGRAFFASLVTAACGGGAPADSAHPRSDPPRADAAEEATVELAACLSHLAATGASAPEPDEVAFSDAWFDRAVTATGPRSWVVVVSAIVEVSFNPGGPMPRSTLIVEEPAAFRGRELTISYTDWPIGSRWCISESEREVTRARLPAP